jgi:hypothetical protein
MSSADEFRGYSAVTSYEVAVWRVSNPSLLTRVLSLVCSAPDSQEQTFATLWFGSFDASEAALGVVTLTPPPAISSARARQRSPRRTKG